MDADTLVERRKLRRRVTFWRVLTFLAVVGAILVGAVSATGDKLNAQIARVPISGFIADDWEQREFLRKLGETDRVKAVILAINSPGGTTGGGEALYASIRDLAEKKPVVASIGTVGASAAYLAAIAADHVVARESSITGSIGVIFQWANVRELADKVGVDVKAIKSDPLKAEPSPFSEETPESRRVIERMIEDTHDWFVDRVTERRDLEPAQARSLADGSIYSGRRALDLKLIDELGGEEQAKAWLVAERGIEADLMIHEWTKPEEEGLLWGAARMLGLADAAERIAGAFGNVADPLKHNGLISIWRPQAIED